MILLERARASRHATAIHEAGHAVAAWHFPEAHLAKVTITVQNMSRGSASAGVHVSGADKLTAKRSALTGEPIAIEIRRRIEADVIICLAGNLAQSRAEEEGIVEVEAPYPGIDTDEGRDLLRELDTLEQEAKTAGKLTPSDDEQVRTLLDSVSAHVKESDTYRDWLYERTRVLVASPAFWKPCIALADALLKRETLTGREALAVIKASFHVPPKTAPEEGAPTVRRTHADPD